MNPYSHEDRILRDALLFLEAQRALLTQRTEPAKPEPSDAEALAVGKVLLAGHRLEAR